MKPTLNQFGTAVDFIDDNGATSIPWDAENNRPLDHEGADGRLWEELKVKHGIEQPDAYVPPATPPEPTKEQRLQSALGISVAELRELLFPGGRP